MTTYITWPKTIDSDFRAFYPTVSGGEVIQTHPHENETHFMVGTSAITTQGVMALAATFADDIAFTEDFPSEFVSNGDEI